MLAAAGCGGGEAERSAPPLPAAVASQLAERSDAVAEKLDAGDGCGALADAEALQQETIAAINAQRVPRRYQEELSAAVAELAASITCEPPPPPPDEEKKDEEKDKDEDDDDEDEKKKEKKKEKKDKDDKGNGKGDG